MYMFELRQIINNKHKILFHHDKIQYVIHEMLSYLSEDMNGNFVILEFDQVPYKKFPYVLNEIKYNKDTNMITSSKPIEITYDKAIFDILNKLHQQSTLLTPTVLKQTSIKSNKDVTKDMKKEHDDKEDKKDKKDEKDNKMIEKINIFKSDKLYFSKIKNNEIPQISEIFKNKYEIFQMLFDSKLLNLSNDINEDDLLTEYINYQEIYDDLYPIQKNNTINTKTNNIFDDIDPFMKRK